MVPVPMHKEGIVLFVVIIRFSAQCANVNIRPWQFENRQTFRMCFDVGREEQMASTQIEVDI